MSSMSAVQLLQALKGGGKLKSRYKPRWIVIGKPKREHILTMPDGSIIYVQKSAIDALIKAHNLRSIAWSGGIYDYEVIG